jgi:NADH:ubiquinone oxidoreductase subunit C
MIYILYSFDRNEYIRIKTRARKAPLPPHNFQVPSVTSLFPAANWLEREVFDMFGVDFPGHPNLKRILMPDDWEGFPLRKDKSIVAMDEEWVHRNLGIESAQS